MGSEKRRDIAEGPAATVNEEGFHQSSGLR
jgi:hypothetical protein